MDYAVIMAGGTGKRLWPLSRQARPKQVLTLIDGQTLLRRCFSRLRPVFDVKHIIVLTNAGYADLVRENLPELPYNNVIAEPAVRDTAGAIGLAASVLTRYDSDATMLVVTADHVIKPTDVFQQTVKDSLNFINTNPDSIVTFGIKPTYASTQFGYVKCGAGKKYPGCENKVHKVEQFKEKPDEATAKKYVQSGQYFWNSGMFVWKASMILERIFKSLPDAKEPLVKIRENWESPKQEKVLQEWFPKVPKISIDYAVMEKAEKVYTIPLDCRWVDMGSFAALADVISSDKDNNVIVAGTSEMLDCKNSIVVTEQKGHLIACIGLDNIVVAHSPDATLVCPIDQADRLKELLESIKKHTGEKFL